MFLPVGNTPGFLIGSPPGPGSMYCPSNASTRAPNSLSATTCLKQNSRYSKSTQLIISNNLPQTKFEVLEERLEHLVLRSFNKPLRRQGLAVRRLAEHPA